MSSKYLYKLDFYIAPGKILEFERGFSKVLIAEREHKRGLGKNIKLYKTFIGGKNIITFLVPMESLSEMDTWMHLPKLVLEFYGQEEGMKILLEYSYAIDKTYSSIIKKYDFK
ncbi:MAG: hypothetical protein E7214_14090 [Clostridium sp.]|nr:hypothetical protein [Clostridium sp.]